MLYAWLFVALTVVAIWAGVMFLPWYDRIIRRTNKHSFVGERMKLDGTWYKVVKIRDSTTIYGPLFGDRYADIFLRRLPEGEAALHEVMRS